MHAGKLHNFIWSNSTPLLAFVNFMAVLHGFISEMGGVQLTLPLAGFYLFVCVLRSSLVCGGVRYKTVPMIL